MIKKIWTLTLLVGTLWTGHSSRPISPGAYDSFFRSEIYQADIVIRRALNSPSNDSNNWSNLNITNICRYQSYCFQWAFLSQLLNMLHQLSKELHDCPICDTMFHQASDLLLNVLTDATYVSVSDTILNDRAHIIYTTQTCLLGHDLQLPEERLRRLPQPIAEEVLAVRSESISLHGSLQNPQAQQQRGSGPRGDVDYRRSSDPAFETSAAPDGTALTTFKGTMVAMIVATSGHHEEMKRLARAIPYFNNHPGYNSLTPILASIGNLFGLAPAPELIQLTTIPGTICAVARDELHFIASRRARPDDLKGILFVGSSIPFSRDPKLAELIGIIYKFCPINDTLFFSYLGEEALSECRRTSGISDLVYPKTEHEDVSRSSLARLLDAMRYASIWLRNGTLAIPITHIQILAYAEFQETQLLAHTLSQDRDFRYLAEGKDVVLAMGNSKGRDPEKLLHVIEGIPILQPNPYSREVHAVMVFPGGKALDVSNDKDPIEYTYKS